MNDQDKQLVGGFYANHPPAWGGYLQPGAPRFDLSFHRPFPHADGTVMAMLMLSEEVQRQFQLLNCSLEIFPNSQPERLKALVRAESTLPGETSEEEKTTPREEDIAHLARDMDWLGTDRARGRKRGAPPARPVGVRVIAEPSPNPASRVRLDDASDAFGQRRAALDWRLDARDSESARETLRVLSREMGASGMGRLRILFPEPGFESVRTVGSHHHMGTTRMHSDSSRGVVDSSCRVHGISNLFIAGSSVFPTYGTANPTYTILALAFRLADHLREELGR
jgi:choline dehydrogenase-like flavoprotein